MKGHPVIHTCTVPCAPQETNHVGIIKNVHEGVFEMLVKECGVEKVIQGPEKQKDASG